ncbi:MAG: DUF1064 domain-containing protein [Blastocatellales bacterium]
MSERMTVAQLRAEEAKTKRNKFHAVPADRDGIRFHSKLEAGRYGELRTLERAGVIKDLRLQVDYSLAVNGLLIAVYRADFVYLENGKEIVEDSKGFRTREYLMKKKLMLALYGIEILETTNKENRKCKRLKTKPRSAKWKTI